MVFGQRNVRLLFWLWYVRRPPFFLLFSVRVIAAGEDEEEEEEECSDYGGGDTAWSILSTERVRKIILEHQACRLLRC